MRSIACAHGGRKSGQEDVELICSVQGRRWDTSEFDLFFVGRTQSKRAHCIESGSRSCLEPRQVSARDLSRTTDLKEGSPRRWAAFLAFQ
jgi:hypothetical protein